MASSNQIAAVAAAMGDPARVNMLMALRYDGILGATELARVGNVAPSTASEHLAKLMASQLVVQQKTGRQRLYSLADGAVCDLVDSIAALADKSQPIAGTEAALPRGVLHARLCLDHLGGELGCLITHALFDKEILRHGRKGPLVTPAGQRWLAQMGIDPKAQDASLRCPLRLCHDWSQEAHHLGGGVAASLMSAFCRRDWLRTQRGQIEVLLTPKGVSAFKRELGLNLRQS